MNNDNKKYELIKKYSIKWGCHTLYRIKALKDFSDVHKGDIGGYIESEGNLSQEGLLCWVYDDAKVFDNARIYGNVKIFGNTEIYGSVKAFDNAKISNAEIYGYARIFDNVEISGDAEIYGNVEISGYATLNGNVIVDGNTKICNNAMIFSNNDYFTISNIGSENGTFTAYKAKEGIIECNRGCFHGTLQEFEDAVKETHGNDKYGKEYYDIIKLVKTKLCNKGE